MSAIRSAVVASFVVSSLVAHPALTRADDFYEGKTITIFVGFSPGGGFDFYARGLAHFIPGHIPGHPTIVVQNLPSAGSLVAARALVTTQPKDGTVMAVFNPGLITQSMIQPKVVKLDFRKFAWVGIATPNFEVCYGYGPSGVSSWDDMMHRKQFVLGASGRGTSNYINGATLHEVFDAPIKQVLGYPGSAEQRLAVERGELDGECSAFSSVPTEWLRDNKAHPFVRFTRTRPPELTQNARFIDDFAKTQDQRDLLDVLDASFEVGRAFAMSADVPAGRLSILRKAFDETMKDPGFLAEMKKSRSPVNPMSGEEADRVVAKMLTVSPAIIAKAKKIYE